MERPLRFGILGCARIARRGVIAGIQASSLAGLAAIASRDGRKAAEWAVEFGIPRHYDSYEALIADPEVDVVYNPLPNELHREWTLRAAAAGKHVLCEKPLGCDLADAQGMVDGCREAGVLLMEAFMWRHHPRAAKVSELLESGRLGSLRLIKMDFSFDIDRSDWRLDPRRGGGALYDLGCYAINAGRYFSGGEPLEVLARAHRGPSGVDMTLGMLLRFADDVLLLADCSFEAPKRNRLEIVGTAGAIELPGGVLPPNPSQLRLVTAEGDRVLEFPAANQYGLQVEHFCRSIAAGRLLPPAEDGLANMRALTAVAAAAG